MAPSTKSKGKGVSASSFFDLKAEISKQEEEFSKNKATGKGNYIVGGVKRPDKKPTVWTRQNKGVSSRSARDVELEAVSKPTLESARSALERKAQIYEKLRKGKTGGLSDKQYDALLVDFDLKGDSFESDSDDVDESLEIPRPPKNVDDDPIVEYEDEFGRIRTARRSEVPRNLVPDEEDQPDEDEDIIIRNPVNHFPVYEPSAERVAEIAAAHSEESNPLNVHYDASQEVRAKGAGFYQFSGDEETRRAQMEELKAARGETSKIRQESGAVDVLPGEIEGMRDTGEGGTTSRAMEKRKRDLEERRKMIEAKRRKVGGSEREDSTTKPKPESTFTAGVPTFTAHVSMPPPSSPPPTDPLAALEAKSKSTSRDEKKKGKARTEADTFLAELEKDFIGSRVR